MIYQWYRENKTPLFFTCLAIKGWVSIIPDFSDFFNHHSAIRRRISDLRLSENSKIGLIGSAKFSLGKDWNFKQKSELIENFSSSESYKIFESNRAFIAFGVEDFDRMISRTFSTFWGSESSRNCFVWFWPKNERYRVIVRISLKFKSKP